MKSFKELNEAAKKPKKKSDPVVFAFGRMNPPTTGHGLVVKKVKELAEQMEAPHEVVLSATHDRKKNPLDPDTKLKHAQAFFPGTNISVANRDNPTLIHHVQRLAKSGHDELHFVAGGDRAAEYEQLLNHYNGKKDKDGKQFYNFKKIEVHSAGDRDETSKGPEGMSGSKMREHAVNDDYDSFKRGVPNHIDDKDTKSLFSAVKLGMTKPVKK